MMKKLNEKMWLSFNNQNIYQSIGIAKSLDYGKTHAGNNVFIGRQTTNNGIQGFVSELPVEKSHCLTIGMVGVPTAFYQRNPFVASQNILVLRNDLLDSDSYIFETVCVNKQLSKYSYGKPVGLERFKRDKTVLPVNDEDNLDYEYMRKYISEKRLSMTDKYRKYIQHQISNLSDAQNVIPLTEKEWAPFILEDIFTISSGTRLETRNKTVGNRPFIGAADNNNGVTGLVSNNNASNDRNVLGVNYNGNGMCIGFYHPYECIFSDDVKRFHLKHYTDNAFVLLFFKVIILQQKSKFGYLYKFNAERMSKQRLLVPINDKGEPDYENMEQYAKNMMLKKYKQYLAFLDSKKQDARVQIP